MMTSRRESTEIKCRLKHQIKLKGKLEHDDDDDDDDSDKSGVLEE